MLSQKSRFLGLLLTLITSSHNKSNFPRSPTHECNLHAPTYSNRASLKVSAAATIAPLSSANRQKSPPRVKFRTTLTPRNRNTLSHLPNSLRSPPPIPAGPGNEAVGTQHPVRRKHARTAHHFRFNSHYINLGERSGSNIYAGNSGTADGYMRLFSVAAVVVSRRFLFSNWPDGESAERMFVGNFAAAAAGKGR